MKPDAQRYPERLDAFTLVELLFVVAILFVMGGMAVIHYRAQMPPGYLDKAALRFAMDMRSARARAISENQPAEVSCDTNALSYAVWVDGNTNGTADTGEIDTESLSNIPHLSMTANASQGSFRPRGTFSCTGGYWEVTFTVDEAGTRTVRVLPGGQTEWDP